jgi:hypothetical protein
MKRKLAKKLALSRESILQLTSRELEAARGARPTLGGTCNGATCIDSCATCYATCVTCGASCTC